MSLDRALLLLYVVLPFLAVLFPWPTSWKAGLFTPGSIATMARIVLLLSLGRSIVAEGGSLGMSGTLVNGYPLEIVLSLDTYRFGFLLTAELCFLFAHWMSAKTPYHGALVRILISLSQGVCSLFVLSDNSVATGALQMLAGVVFFYLVQFSLDPERVAAVSSISRRIYSLFFVLGLILVAWGITEFGESRLLFSAVEYSTAGIATWLLLLILAVPILPWSRWFEQSIGLLPESVSLAIVIFLSAAVWKFSSLFGLVYPDLRWEQKIFIYSLGLLGCAFSLSRIFSASSSRMLVGSMPSFFFSLILVSVGVSRSELVISAYFACIFIPVFAGLALYASGSKLSSGLQKVFIGLFIALMVGLPGTPVFLIFSSIGARSLDLGIIYTLAFALLWFLYFCANIFICRRLFLDKDKPESGAVTVLDGGPVSFAAYGVLLGVFTIMAAQVAWRVL